MSEIPTQDIGALLDEVSSKIPKIIGSLMNSLYSPEIGKNIGQSIGNLYKELKEAGIDENIAVQMAKDYMLTLKGLTEAFNKK